MNSPRFATFSFPNGLARAHNSLQNAGLWTRSKISPLVWKFLDKSPRDTTFFAADFCQQRRIPLDARRHTAGQRSWPWFWRQAHAWTHAMRRLATTETRCANDKRGAPSKQLRRPNQPNHAASPTPSQGQKLPRDLSSHNTNKPVTYASSAHTFTRNNGANSAKPLGGEVR